MIYQILINGEPYKPIKPSNGLSQGDPLSPYVFILSQNIFSATLVKAEADGVIKGIKLGRRSVAINHLLFDGLKTLVQTFCRFQVLKTNFGKSEMVVSKNESFQI